MSADVTSGVPGSLTSAWILGLSAAPFFAVVEIPIFWLIQRDGIAVPIGMGLISGCVSGAWVGRISARAIRRALAAGENAGGLTAAGFQQALVVSRRGPIPVDPAARAAAAELVRGRLERRTRQGSRPIWSLGAMAILFVILGVVLTPWWFLVAGLMGAGLVLGVREPRAMARRLMDLAPDAPAQNAGGG